MQYGQILDYYYEISGSHETLGTHETHEAISICNRFLKIVLYFTASGCRLNHYRQMYLIGSHAKPHGQMAEIALQTVLVSYMLMTMSIYELIYGACHS